MNSCLAGESPPETALSALILRLALRFEFHEFLEADHVEKRSAICWQSRWIFLGAAALLQYMIYIVWHIIYNMHQLHLGPAALIQYMIYIYSATYNISYASTSPWSSCSCLWSIWARAPRLCMSDNWEVNMINDDNEGQFDHDDHNHHDDHGPWWP